MLRGADLGEAELRRRLSQETEQREALSHALQRLIRSAEFCRDRLAVGKPEAGPILDALRPVELDLHEASKVCTSSSSEAGAVAGSYEVLRESLQDMQAKCEELSASLRKKTEANDALEHTLANKKAHVQRLDDQVQAQEAVLDLRRREQAWQAESLEELQRRSRSEAEAREREIHLRHEEALKQLAARESRTTALLAEKLRRLRKGLGAAQNALASIRDALNKPAVEAMLREYLDQLHVGEQKICERVTSYLQAQHARQVRLEGLVSDLNMKVAIQRERHQQESFRAAQQQALLAAGTADLQARSSRELERLSAQLQATSRTVAMERSIAIQEQSRRQRQRDVIEAQRRDAQAAQEHARHDLQRLREAVEMARSDLNRQQEVLSTVRKHTREVQDALSLATNGNEHLKVQLAEYRARSQKVLQEEVVARQAAHEERFLRERRVHEANLAAARDRKTELELQLANQKADAKARTDRIADLGQEVQKMRDEVSEVRRQGAEASTARTVLEDLFAQERSAWNEETLAARISMDKVTLQAESLEEELQLVTEKAAATTSKSAARREEEWTHVEALENRLREAKAELTNAKRRLAAENDALQQVSMELEQQTSKATLEKTNLEAELWRCRFEGESELSQLKDQVDAQRREADAYELHVRDIEAAVDSNVRREGLEGSRLDGSLMQLPSRSPNGVPRASEIQEASPSAVGGLRSEAERQRALSDKARLEAVLADNERLKHLVSRQSHSPARRLVNPGSTSIYEPVTPQSMLRNDPVL